MANLITVFRIISSLLLLLVPTFSFGFNLLYLFAGFTDMMDGAVARKRNTVSEFGSALDTIADFVFLGVCFWKILPELELPFFLLVWIGLIAVIKLTSGIICCSMKKKYIAVHSIMNKITGFLLFILPMTLSFIDLRISGSVVCSVAMIAAIQEGHILKTGKY
ncbi:CDP-alcohol phosphatidyltransferase family protein [Anaerotignum sp.]